MKHLKIKFGLVILLLAITGGSVMIGSAQKTARAEDDLEATKTRLSQQAYDKYVDDEKLTYDEAIIAYHQRVNELFDKKIKQLIDLKPADFKELNPADKFPPCTEDGANLSAYCLGSLAAAEYQGFAKAMMKRRDNYKDVKDCFNQADANSKNPGQTTFKSAAEASSMRSAIIVNEVTVARQALDLSLAAYNELYWAWPLHQEYQTFIKALEKYRDAMAEFRTRVESFPGTFIDASTTGCS